MGFKWNSGLINNTHLYSQLLISEPLIDTITSSFSVSPNKTAVLYKLNTFRCGVFTDTYINGILKNVFYVILNKNDLTRSRGDTHWQINKSFDPFPSHGFTDQQCSISWVRRFCWLDSCSGGKSFFNHSFCILQCFVPVLQLVALRSLEST